MSESSLPRLSVGIPGADEILHGGLPASRAYMLTGGPGTGKTLFGLHFLQAGAERGDDRLYITFEESAASVREDAATVGVDVADLPILDLSPESTFFAEDRGYDLFAADEVESGDVTDAITDAVADHDPDRVFVDPLDQLRHYTADGYQFWKEVASFTTYLRERGCTVLFSTAATDSAPDDDLQFLSDGAIRLARGDDGRTVEVEKLRGSGFEAGSHTLRITGDGVAVYPRLVPREHARQFTSETISSGVDELDALLHGGIERGSVTIVSGPSGVGKTTTATHFAQEAARRDERSVAYLFEEAPETFRHRARNIGVPVDEMCEAGSLALEAVEPLSLSADEFAHRVRREVEEGGARVVVLDGISGYRLAIRGDEDDLVRELHALCRYLGNMGVTTILVDDVGDVTGDFRPTSRNVSYLADNVLFLRYVEVRGEVRKATGVLKKRASDFERTLREFEITDEGLRVGDPLTGLRGVLTGTPDWHDADE